MKNSRMYVSMLLILLLLLSGCAKEQKQKINTKKESASTELSGTHSMDVNQASDYDNGRKVKIRLKKYDEAVIDAYPQKLYKTYSSDKQGYTVLEIEIHNQSKMFFETELSHKTRSSNYTEEIEAYTHPSEMIDSESEKIKELAQNIYQGDLKTDYDI